MFDILERHALETEDVATVATPVDEKIAHELYIRNKLEESLAYAQCEMVYMG
ncbi:hypothetical protein AGMMS4952_08100 [Spirochaetia bacterium]|nr:hypothetical protein AGMMS4952_08100 [Spirochaetia bacterium]